MRHPLASGAIRTALDDADAAVREAAITALDQLGVRGLARRFSDIAGADESRRVRRAAAAALGRASDLVIDDDDGSR
jgi:HEAT repeat protein